tara:strand:- start:86 stop:277 length:192 start_codon:yes stop_codon:yes gene_type:complete
MCLICVELTANRLTSLEARNNLSEFRDTLTRQHKEEVLKLIWQKEDEEYYEMWNEQEMYGDTD